MPNEKQTIVIHDNGNGLGTAGLVFSILGWFTCGLLCPVGALLSFFGLFSRGSKANAVAGLIVGFPGIIFLATMGFSFIAAFLGIGAGATALVNSANETAKKAAVEFEANLKTPQTIPTPSPTIAESIEQPTIEPLTPEESPVTNDLLSKPRQPFALDATQDPTPVLEKTFAEKRREKEAEKIAARPFREWTSKDGKFKTKAKYIARTGQKITIEKEDGSQKEIELSRLSEADNDDVKTADD